MPRSGTRRSCSLTRLQRLAFVEAGLELERDRKDGREPAYGARYVDAVEQVLAAVALHVDAERLPAGPLLERAAEGGEQHVVDLGAVGRRHPLQQRARLLFRQPGLHRTGLALEVFAVAALRGQRAHSLVRFRDPEASEWSGVAERAKPARRSAHAW